MVRGSSPVVRAIVTFAPPVVLSAMTWQYLIRVVAELRAPGVPIKFELQSGEGRWVIRADEYRLNPGLTQLEIDGLSVRDELGTEFATLERLRVGPFRLSYALDQPIRVELAGAQVKIRRLKDGKFNFSRLLSDEKGEPSQTPVSIVASDIRLQYADERVPGRPLALHLIRSQVDLIGDDLVADALVDVEGQRVRAQAEQASARGLWLDVPELALRLPERVAAYIRPELPEGIALGTASGNGRVRAFFGKDQNPAFLFVGRADARDIAIGGKRLPPMTFDGAITERGVAGIGTVRQGKTEIRAVAALTYGQRVSGLASLDAKSSGVTELATLAKPYGVKFDLPASASIDGVRARADIAIRGLDPAAPKLSAIAGRATVSANDVRAEGIIARNAKIRLHGAGDRWTAVVPPLVTSLGPASAFGEIDFRRQHVRAFAELTKFNAANLPKSLQQSVIAGQAQAVAMVAGPLRDPRLAVRIAGDFVAKHPELPNGTLTIPGAQAIAEWSRTSGVQVRRAYAPVAGGFAAMSGALNPRGTASVDVLLADLRTERLRSGFGGLVALAGKVTGTLQNPQAEASAEGYLLTADTLDIPVAKADFRYKDGRIVLDSARALRGTANLAASGTFDPKRDQFRLTAQLENVLLDEVASKLESTGQFQRARGSNLVGRFTAENVVVEGTTRAYRARADIIAPRLGFLSDQLSYQAKNLKASVDFAQNQVRVTDLSGMLLGGRFRGKGTYHLESQRGEVTADAENIQLGLASAEANDIADASGTVSLRASASLGSKGLTRAKVRGTADKVELNRTALGDGQFSADLAESRWRADFGIAQLERFLEVTLAEYHVDSGKLAGTVVASGYPVSDLYQLSSRYLASSARAAAQNELAQLSANVGLSANIGGTVQGPRLAIENLTADQLVYRGIPLGKASLAAEYTPEQTTLNRLDLNGNVGTVLVKGTYRESTGFEIDGEIANFNLAPVTAAYPGVGRINGTVTVPFRLSGTMRDPALIASVDARGLFAPDNDPDRGLRVAIDSIDITPTRGDRGGVLIDGKYNYREFQGRGIFKSPFRWSPELGQIGIPSDEPIEAQIQLEPRQLASMARYVDALSPASLAGLVSGGVQLNGTLADPKLDARLAISEGQMRFRRALANPQGARPTAEVQGPTPEGPPVAPVGRYALIGPLLTNVKGSLNLTERDLQINWESDTARSASATSADGKISLKTGVQFGDLPSILAGAIAGDFKPLLDSPITGKLSLTNVRFDEQLEKGGPAARGRLFAEVDVSSNLRSPLIKGNFRVNDLFAQVGLIEASSEPAPPPIINPRFDLTVSAPNAGASAAIANLGFDASGRVQGSLTAPVVDFLTAFKAGSLNLPGGRVALSKESTINLKYDARSTAASPQLDVELVGSTSVVTTLYSQIPERYNVNLTVTGNLLNDGGLVYDAESTPAGLSKDQILGLLGGTEIITAFGTTGQRELAEERLRQAVVGLAVPLVFEQITRPLAKSVGLDFIGIDYNAIDGATISSAKSLSRDFNLFVSRQFQQPDSGAPLRYELRLDYRPRRLPGYLNRFTFSLGRDEIAPVKLSATYTIRF